MYTRKVPIIEVDGFVVMDVEDVQPQGLYLTESKVVDGRTRISKRWVHKSDIHNELVKALGLKFDEPLKTPQEWCDELGARILDHDGWRGDPGRSWHDRITRAEFDRRLTWCTIDSTGYPEFRVVPNRDETTKQGAQKL